MPDLHTILERAVGAGRPAVRAQTRGPVWNGPLPRNHWRGETSSQGERARAARNQERRLRRLRPGSARPAGHQHDLVSVTLSDGSAARVACAVPGCGHAYQVAL